MKAQKTKKTLNVTDDVFQLELSFVEMHIIMKAMSEYQRLLYNPHGRKIGVDYNVCHAEAAEKLHNELTELYTN